MFTQDAEEIHSCGAFAGVLSVVIFEKSKEDIIAKALQELARIRQAVEADTLAVDTGAAQISLTARTAFDALMNHRTVYAAKYEVLARQLGKMGSMMENGYPVMFSALSKKDKAAFARLCDKANEVVTSCQ